MHLIDKSTQELYKSLRYSWSNKQISEHHISGMINHLAEGSLGCDVTSWDLRGAVEKTVIIGAAFQILWSSDRHNHRRRPQMHLLLLKLHLWHQSTGGFFCKKNDHIGKVPNKMPRIKGCTCRALILLWTFSWDKTLAGSASVRTWSSRKMLSWDSARDPMIPWEHLW